MSKPNAGRDGKGVWIRIAGAKRYIARGSRKKCLAHLKNESGRIKLENGGGFGLRMPAIKRRVDVHDGTN